MSAARGLFGLVAALVAGGCSDPSDGPDAGAVSPGDAHECPLLDPTDLDASGTFYVLLNNADIGPWRVGIAPALNAEQEYDVVIRACVLEGGVELWRFSAGVFLKEPVKGSPVELFVPTQLPPGMSGGLLDVVAQKEYHFILDGAGKVTVTAFDPDARVLRMNGEIYPVMGGTIGIVFDLSY